MNELPKSKQSPDRCVYWDQNPGISQDHVPSKGFFPRLRPSNLITVPACKNCNSGAGKDENYILATFMFGAAGITEQTKYLVELDWSVSVSASDTADRNFSVEALDKIRQAERNSGTQYQVFLTEGISSTRFYPWRVFRGL